MVSYRQSIGVLPMTYKGHIANGTVVLDEPMPLQDGTVVRVEVVAEAASTVLHPDIERFTGVLPADVAVREVYVDGMLKKHS